MSDNLLRWSAPQTAEPLECVPYINDRSSGNSGTGGRDVDYVRTTFHVLEDWIGAGTNSKRDVFPGSQSRFRVSLAESRIARNDASLCQCALVFDRTETRSTPVYSSPFRVFSRVATDVIVGQLRKYSKRGRPLFPELSNSLGSTGNRTIDADYSGSDGVSPWTLIPCLLRTLGVPIASRKTADAHTPFRV